jgi:hypothetical protein
LTIYPKEDPMPTLTAKTLKWGSLGVAVAVAALAVAAGCGGGTNTMSVQLGEQAGSGQSGTATLSAQGSKTRVAIELSNPAAGPQPSHIHQGTCENPNPQPSFALSNVVNGRAETTVDASLDELQGDGDYYVNVHKSAAEIETVVACGDLAEGSGAGGGSGGGYVGGY